MEAIDSAVGQRIRKRRKMMGMSQTDLADRVGVKFQQIQKYETGVNRVAASRLWKIAEVLEVSVVYFFEELESMNAADPPEANPASAREATEMVRIFNRLPRAQQLAMSSFLQSLQPTTEDNT